MYEVDQYTVSLLHFEDGLKDETGKNWTAVNGASLSHEKSKFGNSSIYFNGIRQSIQTPASEDFIFGTSDFTIDFYLNWSGEIPGSLGGSTLFGQNPIATCNVRLSIFPGGRLKLYCNNDAVLYESPANTIQPNIWMHLALVRHNTDFYIFIDGKLIKKIEYKAALPVINYPWEVGDEESADCGYKGYIDEFRISKGIARWTSDFDTEKPSQQGLLRITMNDSSEREYQLSYEEINKFIAWCDRTVGTGKTLYIFDKVYNVGEFKSRKEYLLFEKIISFEVMELTK